MNMTILAIETTAGPASAAIVRDRALLAECTLNYKMTHSQTIMPMISGLLGALSLSAEDMDYIACSSGPGSFTGLRIGAATAKGLAMGAGKPIVPVPTLDALAYNIYESAAIVCPVMDARRGQVYTSLYEWRRGRLNRLAEYMAAPLEEIVDKALSFGRGAVFTGDALYALPDREGVIKAPASCNMQRAACVAALAEELIPHGKAIDGGDFVPFYIRKPQAEREREERLAAENTGLENNG